MKWGRTFKPSQPLPGEFWIETIFINWRFSYYARWSHEGSAFSISSYGKTRAIREVEAYARAISDYKKYPPPSSKIYVRR